MDEKETNIVKPKSGLAVAGLVLGIVAICISFIPAVGMAAIFLAVVGLILSAIGIKGTGVNAAKCGRGMAIAGLVLCLVAGVISITQQAVCSAAIDAADEATTSTTATTDDGDANVSDSGTLELKIGDAAKCSNGLKVIVLKKKIVTDELDGKKYLAVKVKYKNTGSDEASFNELDWKCEDKKGARTDAEWTSVDGLKSLGSGDLASSATTSGWIIFKKGSKKVCYYGEDLSDTPVATWTLTK
jgi:hypothetical protein